MDDRNQNEAALGARDNTTNTAADQARINAQSGSSPIDGNRQNSLSGTEGAGTTVRTPDVDGNASVDRGPTSGLTASPGEMRLADRITIRVHNPGSGELKLLLAGDPKERDVNAADLCALIEDRYFSPNAD